jgi:lactose/L-arabinose transport system permease protein
MTVRRTNRRRRLRDLVGAIAAVTVMQCLFIHGVQQSWRTRSRSHRHLPSPGLLKIAAIRVTVSLHMMTRRFWQLQHRLSPYLFLSPFLILFAVFFAYPLLRSFWLSFCSTIGSNHVRFVGLKNYAFLLHDLLFWGSLGNTAIYVVIFLLIQIPLSLLLAVQLNNQRVIGRNVLRFAFFSTSLVGPVFAAVIFSQFLNPRHDLVALLCGRLVGHSVTIPWLTNPVLARVTVLIAWLWLSVGFGMMYLLAALQAVDVQLYEAADIDGAGTWARFWHITLPGVKPVLVFLIVVGLISGLQLFELPYVQFQGPGPGYAGFTIVMYLFAVGFQQGNLGYASAIGWALVIVTALATVPRWATRRN